MEYLLSCIRKISCYFSLCKGKELVTCPMPINEEGIPEFMTINDSCPTPINEEGVPTFITDDDELCKSKMNMSFFPQPIDSEGNPLYD